MLAVGASTPYSTFGPLYSAQKSPEDQTKGSLGGSKAGAASSKDGGKSDRNNKTSSPGQLDPSNTGKTPEELKQIQALKARDREVKAHEQAHMAAGGRYVRGGPSYEYQQGPDGKRYAIGGEVSIDVSPESDPEETIRKMEVVIKAALAPARPSAQDRAVAARAQAQKAQASAELTKEEAQTNVDMSQTSNNEERDLGASGQQYPPGSFLNIYA